MDSFGFTKKKFLQISRNSQHKHIIRWLSGIYHAVTTNRFNPDSLELFLSQYCQILEWLGMPALSRPESDTAQEWLEKLSDQIHSHRLAAGLTVRDHDLLEKVITRDQHDPAQNHGCDCHIALDGLRSMFNVGSIFRTCEAAGFRSIILGNTPGREDKKIQKTAMGAEQWVDQEKTDDLAQTLLGKKELGYEIVGVETVEGSSAFNEFIWKDKTILVFGNEEYGIASHVLRICDTFVHIPMFGKKNSINVANAVATVCFQAACAFNQ